MKKFFSYWKIYLIVFIVLIGAVTVWVLNLPVYRPGIVTGDSMCPTLCNGQSFMAISDEPKEGDIITLRVNKIPETAVVKRLVKIESDNWWVQGDNTDENSYDSRDFGWLKPEDREFIGVVTEVKYK